MRLRFTCVFLFLLSLLPLACRTVSTLREAPLILRGQTMDKWRALIVPTGAELAWAQIPWLPTLSEGIERANLEGKPLLLWLMNGHPLGCT